MFSSATVMPTTRGPAEGLDSTGGGPGEPGEPMVWSGPPLPRQCGRCRSTFAGDRSLGLLVTSKWWACPGCHLAMFGDDAGPHRAAWATTVLASEPAAPVHTAAPTAGGIDDGARR
jgi:hypothetical protein